MEDGKWKMEDGKIAALLGFEPFTSAVLHFPLPYYLKSALIVFNISEPGQRSSLVSEFSGLSLV